MLWSLPLTPNDLSFSSCFSKVRGKRPGKQVNLSELEIRDLCLKSREVFISQPILLELEAPIKIVGDIHGQYYDLLRLFEYGGFPPDANYLFLGGEFCLRVLPYAIVGSSGVRVAYSVNQKKTHAHIVYHSSSFEFFLFL